MVLDGVSIVLVCCCADWLHRHTTAPHMAVSGPSFDMLFYSIDRAGVVLKAPETTGQRT